MEDRRKKRYRVGIAIIYIICVALYYWISHNRSETERKLVDALDHDGVQVVRLMLDKGMDANRGYGYVDHPLNMAAWNGSMRVAKLLVANGANVNDKDESGETPLMHAAMYDQVKMLRFLLDRGARVDARDKDGQTAFYNAVCYDYLRSASPTLRNSFQEWGLRPS